MRAFLFSIFLFSGLPSLGWYLYTYFLEKRAEDPKNTIRYIVQKERRLSENSLAHLLKLDHATSIYHFSPERGAKLLEQNLFIEKAHIKTLDSDTLFIDVALRKPVARIGDIESGAIDKEGRLFPLKPYHSPKRLCTLYLGLDPAQIAWGVSLKGERYQKAADLLKFISQRALDCGIWAERIDTARAFEASLGRCEIVVHFEEHSHKETPKGHALLIHRWIVRLPTEGFEKRWPDFRALAEKLKAEHSEECRESGRFTFDPRIIDLRVEDLGFVQ